MFAAVDFKELEQTIAAGGAAKRFVALGKRLAKYRKEIAMLRSYNVSCLGEKLGEPVSTPCEAGSDADLRARAKSMKLVLVKACRDNSCCNPAHALFCSVSDAHRDSILRGRDRRGHGDIAGRLALLESEVPRIESALEILREVLSGHSRPSPIENLGSGVELPGSRGSSILDHS